MALTSMKELLKWATEKNRAICGLNVNNMELVQAITEAAAEEKAGAEEVSAEPVPLVALSASPSQEPH